MASLKKCISQHCKNCTYDQESPGTWREQVENCTVVSCALYEVRPMTMTTINANRKTRGVEIVEEMDADEEMAV
jgi:hypothetical protein